MIEIKSDFGCRIVKASLSKFGHQFGGGQEYRGTVPSGGQKPVPLIFRLNLRDPLAPIRIKGVDWLPLFYPFIYNGCGMGYRVLGDFEIEILMIETTQVEEDFPFPDYPEAFPQAPVELIAMSYEETKVLAFFEYLHKYLLWDKLRDNDRAILDSAGRESARMGTAHTLVQEVPRFRHCPDSRCESRYSLRPFCTIWNEPVKGVDVWQADGEPIQIIYQICSECGAIQTENQCT